MLQVCAAESCEIPRPSCQRNGVDVKQNIEGIAGMHRVDGQEGNPPQGINVLRDLPQ